MKTSLASAKTPPQRLPRTSRPGLIHLRIIEMMKRFPEGVTGGQIRQHLGLAADEQTHLEKRKRELKQWFVIRKSTALNRGIDGKSKRMVLYQFEGELDPSESPVIGRINNRVRAQILHGSRGRCQMCGRTIDKHSIALVIDHKKPLNWGGTNDITNLWAICEECNGGKKEYFSSVITDDGLMRRIMSENSVHVRLGETLKAFGIGTPVPAYLLELIADQDEWRKRIRDLRYAVIGWRVGVKKYKKGGRVYADYVLESWQPWSGDPTGDIRRFEMERKQHNALVMGTATQGSV